MKEKFTGLLKWIIDKLSWLYDKLQLDSSLKKFPYHSLSPIKSADEDNCYFNALTWAIENRKNEDIKNIAIAGPFGSGKSSVLKTFEKKNTNQDLHILNISLANFKNGEISEGETQKKDLPRLIELSILQQIFYHEKDSKIPDSRFRKIRSFRTVDLLIKTFGALLFSCALINIFFQNSLVEILKKIGLTLPDKSWLTITSLIILFIGISILIFNSVRAIHSLRVSKFKIKDAEIEVDKSVNKSILNHHLDEILYFFEVTKYNVVVIEDLDRFGQTEIFTKLREINLLINNSKKINKDVVFVYAIRDDMFLDEERTKFFDFVIPIIPVINSSNSNEILLEKKTQNKFDISDNLIDNISLFIEDMRILHNIINEYFIYHSKLDKKLDQDKLLSMIVYKNMFPNDFTKLSRNEGNLFKTLAQKKNYIKLESKKIDEQIALIEKEIQDLESLKIHEIKELRTIYLFHYINKLNSLNSFTINGVDVSPNEMLEDKYFKYLVEDKVPNVVVFQSGYHQPRTRNNPVKFDNVSKEINDNETYDERVEKINKWHKNHVNKLRKKIEELENKKQEIKSVPISKLIKPIINEDNSVSKQEILINVLLRNSYINEDYLDYISIFYEGSLSKQDHQFLLNVKAELASEFDYNLIKIDKLISKINPNDFKESHILNYKLVNHILTDNKKTIQKTNVFEQLSNESKKSIGFIDGFIQNESNVPLFIENLCSYWGNIWNYISNFSNFTNEKKEKYLKLILCHAKINDLKEIAKNSDLKQLIEYKANFVDFINDDIRVKEIIEKLEVKFEKLDVSKSSSDVIEFIYSGYYYGFNAEILKVLVDKIGELNESSFNTSNYNSIKTSGCDDLLEHIKFHINEYIENVYFAITTNISEVEVDYIELLGNKELSAKNIEKLVNRTETKISDVTLLEGDNIADVILKYSKVVPTWANVMFYYENNDGQISNELLQFLNQESNYNELSKNKIPTDNKENNENRYRPFILSLIKQVELNDNAYNYLLKSVPYIYNNIDFEDLPYKKVKLLLDNKILVLTSDNYNNLKEKYEDLHIGLVIYKKAQFLKSISDYEIDQDDFFLLISSNGLSSEEKNLILNDLDESIIISNSNTLVKIGNLILESSLFSISSSILKRVLLTNSISVKHKIKILALKQSQLDSDLLTDFLNSLGEPFEEITISGKKPLLDYNEENLKLAEILKTEDYISNFKIEEDKGIRIYTFRKQRE